MSGPRLGLVAATLLAAAGPARAEGFDRLSEGAVVYVQARPAPLLKTMQRLGIDQLPAVQNLKKSLGGIDPFNPIILAAPGIDLEAPLVASLLEPVGSSSWHARVVAKLRDKATFSTFVLGVIASGQVPLGPAPAGIADAVGAGSPQPSQVLLLRVVGEEAVLDMIIGEARTTAPAPALVAKRYPLAPAKPFVAAHGARRLLASDAAAAVYIDARHIVALTAQARHDDQKRALAALHGPERAKLAGEQQKREKKCQALEKSPALFDDAGLQLKTGAGGLDLTWAWGTQSGPPLGGLRLSGSDDGAVDAAALGRASAASFTLYAASLAPFTALKRGGIYSSADTTMESFEGCDDEGVIVMFFRSWPLALGATLGAEPSAGSPFAMAKDSLGTLHNVTVAMRELDGPNGPRGAVVASFDNNARAMFDLLIAALGGKPGPAAKFGSHAPTVYSLNLPNNGRALPVGLETLPGNRLGITVADSDESLAWAYKTGGTPANLPILPLLRLSADLAQLKKLEPRLHLDADGQALFDLFLRLRHVDGSLVSDGDLLGLTLHAPLKP